MGNTNPPGPGKRLWREPLRLRRLGPHAYIGDLAARFGDLVLVEVRNFKAYLVSDPDLIRQILVEHDQHTVKGREIKRLIPYIGQGLLTSDGEAHRQQRRRLQPLFHRHIVATYAKTMASLADQIVSMWSDDLVIDMNETMARLTMTVFTRTLLDLDLDAAEASALYRDLRTTLHIYAAYLGLPFDVLLHLPLPATRRYYAALRHLNQTLFRLIAERREHASEKDDLLTVLLANSGEGDEGHALSSPEVRDQVMTFFFAGHETLSSALPWAWYCLARSPDSTAKLQMEVDQVLGDHLPTAEDLPRLPYTTAVLQETLRLYPPIISLTRRVITPFSLGGYTIPCNAHLYMSQYVVQRDPRWWPDPTRFDPDRFLPESDAQRPRFSYFPFGGGARQCIGEHFALLEGVMTLATIARRWTIDLISQTDATVSKNIITLRPKSGLRMRIRSRRAD